MIARAVFALAGADAMARHCRVASARVSLGLHLSEADKHCSGILSLRVAVLRHYDAPGSGRQPLNNGRVMLAVFVFDLRQLAL